jgi:hypothetical protein
MADHTGKGPRVGHLTTLGDVLKEMASVYREVRLGKTKPDLGCKLVYILREMRAALEAETLERLERRLDELTPNFGTRAYGHPNADRPFGRAH